MFDVTEQVGLGLGWGGDVHVLRTCTRVLAFMFDVTEQVGLGLEWGGDVHVLRTCTHVLEHRNMLDAMHLVQIKMPVSFLSNMLDATAVMRWGGVG